jgi:hypothetical protein
VQKIATISPLIKSRLFSFRNLAFIALAFRQTYFQIKFTP